MEIVRLKENDLKDALALIWTVFSEFEAPDYPPEGVREFRSFIAYDPISTMYAQGIIDFWGCLIENTIVGVIALKDLNHISLLFVKKEYHRLGIAKKLFQAVLNDCLKKEQNTITVNSSPYALEAYRHMGFTQIGEEQLKNGIRFIPMIYNI